MGILSFFRKASPEDIYREIAQKIVFSSLSYRTVLNESNSQLSANAGAEVAYLLLHIVDREAFRVIGSAMRNQIFDEVSKRVISDYSKAILHPDTPKHVSIMILEQMIKTMNERQMIYSQCNSIFGDIFPSKGTMVFAFSFFVHRALGRTNRDDVGDILSGKRNLSDSDMKDFPDSPQLIQSASYIGNTLSSIKIPEYLKKLK